MSIQKEHNWSISEYNRYASEKDRFLLNCRIYCTDCNFSPDVLPQPGEANYFCTPEVGEL